MSTTTTTSAPTRWAGWYRPHKRTRWTRICQAASYEDCWGKLLEKRPAGSPRTAELLVTRAEANPNDSRTPGPTRRTMK
jgi:hypothetical protein